MPTPLENFFDRISEPKSLPIGFFGSGFSQRYLGSPTWSGLLEHFAEVNGKRFNYYRGLVDADEGGYLPEVARLIAKDLYPIWFESDEYRDSREQFESRVEENADPLKFEIAKYLSSLIPISTEGIILERARLSKVQLHAIVTTNWDKLLDESFKDLKPYVGQEELIFSNSFSIGEIYKIHGCISDPRSLILTSQDYKRYEERNSYLVAKLLTMFIEHPILFVGYSIQDENVRSIFRQIIGCLNQAQINTLSSRIFFINRVRPNRPAGMGQTAFDFGSHQLTVWNYVTDDLGEVYDVLAQLPRHYPVQFLRKLQRDVFSLALDSNPETMIRVVDFNNESDLSKVEVVIGVGVMSKLSAKGYVGYERIDLVRDMLKNAADHNKELLLENTLPRILRGKELVPIYYPLFIAGRLDEAGKLAETSELPPSIVQFEANRKPLVSLHTKEIGRRRTQNFAELLTEGEEIALGYGIVAKYEVNDIVALRKFLSSKSVPGFPKGKYETAYWKLSCLYDRMVYGSDWDGDRRALHEALSIGVATSNVTAVSDPL